MKLEGNRKLCFFSLQLLCAFVVALVGKLTAEYAEINVLIAIGFAGANSVEHGATAFKAARSGVQSVSNPVQGERYGDERG